MTIGLTEEEFWACTPHRLQAYISAFKAKQNQNDYNNWIMGMYNCKAFLVALDASFNGRKARTKYFEKPFYLLEDDKKYIDGSDLSEEEKEKLRQQFVENLKLMEASHNAFVERTKG